MEESTGRNEYLTFTVLYGEIRLVTDDDKTIFKAGESFDIQPNTEFYQLRVSRYTCKLKNVKSDDIQRFISIKLPNKILNWKILILVFPEGNETNGARMGTYGRTRLFSRNCKWDVPFRLDSAFYQFLNLKLRELHDGRLIAAHNQAVLFKFT